MTKYFLTLGLLCLSLPALASDKYKCFSVDDNEPYGIEKLELTVKSETDISVKLDALKLVTEKYELDDTYKPKASMKNYLKFDVRNPDYTAYGEGPVTPFFLETELLTGGYPLRRGGKGAFMKTTGHGYSWASYLCVLQE